MASRLSTLASRVSGQSLAPEFSAFSFWEVETRYLFLLLWFLVSSTGACAAQMDRPYGGRPLKEVLLDKALKKGQLMAAARTIRDAVSLVRTAERRLIEDHIVVVDPRVDFASGWQAEDIAYMQGRLAFVLNHRLPVYVNHRVLQAQYVEPLRRSGNPHAAAVLLSIALAHESAHISERGDENAGLDASLRQLRHLVLMGEVDLHQAQLLERDLRDQEGSRQLTDRQVLLPKQDQP